MLVRLLPVAIILIAVLLILLSRNASKKKTDAYFLAAGLGDLPQGKPLSLHGQKRPTHILDDTYISIGQAKTRISNPVTVVGTHRPHEDKDTFKKETITSATHLWVIYPQPYPFTFSFSAGPGEQPLFEGNFDDMSDLLTTEKVALPAQALLKALAPLGGELWMDNAMMDIILPKDTEVSPELVEKAMELWRAVREGSEYPFTME